jgi:four helix bundle protein
MTVRNFKDLIVWNKSMELAVEVHALVQKLPRTEQYRLIDQILRASASVPANIAEGHARSSRKDYGHFLAIAQGSLSEVETFLLLAVRIGYLQEPGTTSAAFGLIDEVARMLGTMRSRLRT